MERVIYRLDDQGICGKRSPLRYAKSGMSPAPNAYVSEGRRTRRTVRTRRVVANVFIDVVAEREMQRARARYRSTYCGVVATPRPFRVLDLDSIRYDIISW